VAVRGIAVKMAGEVEEPMNRGGGEYDYNVD